MERIEELIKQKEEIKPIYGNVYTMEDAQVLNEIESRFNTTDIGKPAMNEDGTFARTPKKYLVVNPVYLYMNRYRKVDDKTIEVCVDTDAIKRQGTGAYITKDVIVYEIGRNDKREKLKVKRVKTVPTEVFETEFTHKLNNKAMAEKILPILQHRTDEITADDLDI